MIDSHLVRGQRQYLVDWEGYGPEERSWEPAKHILDPGLISDFLRYRTELHGKRVGGRALERGSCHDQDGMDPPETSRGSQRHCQQGNAD